MIDLGGKRAAPHGAVAAMAQALYHRGPDEDGFLNEPGLELANTRLHRRPRGRPPAHLERGRQRSDRLQRRVLRLPREAACSKRKGHRFRTHTDTEIIPHLWEDHRHGLFEHLKGQFAVCVWDKKSNEVVLGRDRSGICPAVLRRPPARQPDWLLFASEAKALFASGLVQPKADWARAQPRLHLLRALPGPVTVFDGVTILQPGHYLHLKLGSTTPAEAERQTHYWRQLPRPRPGGLRADEKKTVDGFEEVLLAAVNRRLRADVPVVSYLSGGVDSSLVVAMANKVLGRPIPTFTISIGARG